MGLSKGQAVAKALREMAGAELTPDDAEKLVEALITLGLALGSQVKIVGGNLCIVVEPGEGSIFFASKAQVAAELGIALDP